MATTSSWDRNAADYSEKEWQARMTKAKLGQDRLKQFNTQTFGYAANDRTAAFGNTKTNTEFGGDWTQGNGMFSFDTIKQQAKDLAAQNLENSRNLMGLSYEYRTKEKGFDSDIRQREANQQFGFTTALEGIRNTQQSKYQSDQFAQDNNMFDRNKQMQNESMASARSVANNLYFGGFSNWRGGRR